jgi:hypothetical protein
VLQVIADALFQWLFSVLDAWAQKPKQRRRIYLGITWAVLGLLGVGSILIGLYLMLFAQRASDRVLGALMLALVIAVIWLLGVGLSQRRRASGSE